MVHQPMCKAIGAAAARPPKALMTALARAGCFAKIGGTHSTTVESFDVRGRGCSWGAVVVVAVGVVKETGARCVLYDHHTALRT